MLTRRFLGTAVAALVFVAASGTARAAERSLLGIVLGRSYRQVLAKFGSPDRVQVVNIPVPGQANTGTMDPNAPGGPAGYGGPGGYGGPPGGAPGGPAGYGGAAGGTGGGPVGYGGPPGGGPSVPSYGAPVGTGMGPGGYGGPPGGGSGGGPPVLPPVGGAPGMPGSPDTSMVPGGVQVGGVGNGAEWIYNRPGGTTLAFIINEDGRVAQISVSSSKAFPAARTARGVTLQMDYRRVLTAYGWPQTQLIGAYYVETYYTKSHHASFTFVKGKLVRITIALAD